MSGVSDDATLAAAHGPDDSDRSFGCAAGESHGQTVLYPTRDEYVDVVKALTDDGFTLFIDLCGVDYLHHLQRPLPSAITPERFEVVVNLLDITRRRRVRLRVQVPESDPTLPSLFDVHPGSEAYERETYDMFGVVFTDHPDMTRILMPEDWIGHPLRKDYAIGRIPVQFKGANS